MGRGQRGRIPLSNPMGVVPLRRNKQFQLLWVGSAVSQVGMELTRLATPLLVLALTGSPGWAGIVAGARTAASVMAQLPAGVWVDRWDRRRTLIAVQGLQTVNAAVLAALIVGDRALVWHFVVTAVIDGGCAAFLRPTRTTAIRGVVPTEQLPNAYAQEQARLHAARLIGPPLGALLYGLGRAVPFVVDAVTFLVAALCAAGAKVPRRPKSEPGGRRSMRRDMGEAVAWLWRQRGLRAVWAVVMMLNLLSPAYLLPLIVLVGERGGGALGTGTVLAGAGIGGLVGALLSGRVGRLLPPGKLTIVFTAVFGASIVAMALPFGPWWPMGPLVLFSLTMPAFNVVTSVVIARLAPEEMLGRVDAVLTAAGFGLSPLGPVLGGALAAALGGAGSIVLIGGLMLLTAAGAALSGDLRRFSG
ncbi:MFS transporter [Nonomuraea sp. NPDC050451]|uniref:MFS transporter n=1 Tax=Nonomuraea sp. NPDC050451 TaxID=3364364 RepID=UPI0037B2F2AB